MHCLQFFLYIIIDLNHDLNRFKLMI